MVIIQLHNFGGLCGSEGVPPLEREAEFILVV